MNRVAGWLRPAGPAGLALGISLAGGLTASAVGLPAAFLVGGAAAVTAAALLSVPLELPGPLRNAAFVVIGMTLGSSVARDTLALIGQWPVTMLALVAMLAVIVGGTALMLTRVFTFDAPTAVLAATPGHASFIQGLALSGLGDARRVAVVQSIRVLTLIIAVPLLVEFAAPGALATPTLSTAMAWPGLAGLAAACAVAGWLADRAGMPAGFVIGAMVVATAARLGGLTEGTVPATIRTPGFVVIAALIGSRFAGVPWPELRRALAGGLAATGLAVAVSAAAAWLASLAVDFSFGEIWIAIAPGGLDGMAVMGLMLGYDPAFVMAHHAARLLVLALAMPAIVAVMARRARAAGD